MNIKEENLISNITIITQPGPCTYSINKPVPMSANIPSKPIIGKIVKGSLCITGDPFSHYLGYTVEGELLFSINCMAPCVVEYIYDKN